MPALEVSIMGWIADLLKEIPSAARYKAELEAMEKENTSLKAENAQLKAQLDTARKELAAVNAPASGLAKDAESVLVFIARHENSTVTQIARALGLNKDSVEMHLEDLATSKHIDASYVAGEEPEQYLLQGGRRYLHDKGLL
jgi:predicted RNase H-like nuclease (RuvC/YqgF family)